MYIKSMEARVSYGETPFFGFFGPEVFLEVYFDALPKKGVWGEFDATAAVAKIAELCVFVHSDNLGQVDWLENKITIGLSNLLVMKTFPCCSESEIAKKINENLSYLGVLPARS